MRRVRHLVVGFALAGLAGTGSLGQNASLTNLPSGTVVAWGFLPASLPRGLTNVVAVTAGESHSVALKADGTVVAWGYSSDGETNVPPGLSNIVAISAGNNHTLALRSD